MGAWGTAPWDSDDAADWFSSFFEGVDVEARIDDAFSDEEDYDRIRAGSYMLSVLGRTYVWPGDLERLDELLERGIELLTAMISPGSDFREIWENDPEIIDAVRSEIADLEARLEDDDDDDDDDEEADDDDEEEIDDEE